MSLQRIILDSPLSAVGFQSVCNLAPGPYEGIQALINYLGAVQGGQQAAQLSIQVGAVQASGTVTFASTGPTNSQTCTIAGVTFTAVTSGATGQQFNISSTPAVVAANLAAAINAHAPFSGILSASSLLGVVTIRAVVPGTVGNFLAPLANVNLSNATFASWSGGSQGTSSVINFL